MQQRLIADFDLAGRVAVVTGAASGIGRDTAIVLAEAGARPVICDVDEAGLAETARLVEQVGGAPLVRRVDVSSRAEIEALADFALAEAGRIDAWVNVAGILVRGPMLEAREDELDRMIAINLKGVYWGCVAAARAMSPLGRGCVVNISSGGAESAPPHLSIYALTKAAVNSITRTAAREFGPLGIRVNAVSPGWVDTPLGNSPFRDAEGAIDPDRQQVGLRQREQVSPLGITGVPRDIALAVLYLVADASRFVTGQILRPNGGVAMP